MHFFTIVEIHHRDSKMPFTLLWQDAAPHFKPNVLNIPRAEIAFRPTRPRTLMQPQTPDLGNKPYSMEIGCRPTTRELWNPCRISRHRLPFTLLRSSAPFDPTNVYDRPCSFLGVNSSFIVCTVRLTDHRILLSKRPDDPLYVRR